MFRRRPVGDVSGFGSGPHTARPTGSRSRTGALRTLLYLLCIYLMLCFYNLFLGIYLYFPAYEWGRVLLPVPEAALAAVLLLPAAFRAEGSASQVIDYYEEL